MTSIATRRSKRNPEHSKRVLIAATLDTIAEFGISDTTVTTIIGRAGLSRGMIHLHFGGKSQLLSAAARSFSEQYYAELDQRVQAAGRDPETVIKAVIQADLSEALMNVRSTRIWHAFRGAAGTDPGIATYSNTRDRRLREIIWTAFSEIAATYDFDPRDRIAKDATYGLLSMLEGMWVDYIANSEAFSRDEASAIIHRFLAGLFANHFSDRGKS